MTHLEVPYLSTTRYNHAPKKSKNKRRIANQTQYDNWLRKQGLHPEQRKLVKAFKGEYKNIMPDLKVKVAAPLSNNIAISGGFRHGVMDNLHNETPEIQRKIMEKAMCTEVAYNKGPIMYHSPGTDRSQLGSRSRRG